MSTVLKDKPKMLRKKYTISVRGERNPIITVPESFLVANGLKIGDKVFVYMLGNDLLFSKNEY